MLFITNREPVGSARSRNGRRYRFDLTKSAPTHSLFYCQRRGENDYREIGSDALLSSLRQSHAKQLLFYLHGFANQPEPDIFPRALQLQAMFDAKEPGLVEVVPLIWPCDDGVSIVKDYWDDQKSADVSAFSFSRLLQRFMDWRDTAPDDAPCLKRINILAHSMGNRVLRETLVKWSQYDLASGVPLLFRNALLVAADIINESFEAGQGGRLISESSRNVLVYYAADDLALRASKISNLKNRVASRRLGHTGPENMDRVRNNVYAIDCDNFNNRYDMPKGHAYFLHDEHGQPGVLFEHMFETIRTGRAVVDTREQRQYRLS